MDKKEVVRQIKRGLRGFDPSIRGFALGGYLASVDHRDRREAYSCVSEIGPRLILPMGRAYLC